MNIVRHAKQLAAVAAAFTGLSFSVAYSAPGYTPPLLSPLDTTTLDSSSTLLDNFNGYLNLIEAQLATGFTLALPEGPAVGGEAVPTDLQYYTAVAAAVAAAAPADQGKIVSAAIQYKPGKVKDIVKNVVLLTPTAAPAAVSAASIAVPAKAGDAAAGAIFALIAKAAENDVDPNNAALADAANDAVIAQTRELIEKVAKSAVAATKASTSQVTSATAVAGSIMDAYMADALTPGSTAGLYLDDIGRGLISGIHGFADAKKADLATAMLAKFVVLSGPVGSEVLVPAPGVTQAHVINFAMGALKASLFLADTASLNAYGKVRDAIVTTTTAFKGGLDGVHNSIVAGAMIQSELRNLGLGVDPLLKFSEKLTATEAPYLAGYVSGAVQVIKGRAGDFTRLAFEDAQVGTLTVAQMKSVAATAVTGNFGAASKVVTNAIVNASATNKLTAVQAVEAVIPAASELYSGVATLAAVKTLPITALASDAQVILASAINTAESAGYLNSLGDIALNAVKARKIFDNQLVATAINEVPNGWEEAVAALVIANNPKDKPEITGPIFTNRDAALDAAGSKVGADLAGVTLAVDIAIAGKLSTKTLFDDAIERTYQNPTKARAILFGAGAVNTKLAIPLMSMLMRLKSGGDTDAVLQNYAVSLNKKAKFNIQLAYEAAFDAIAAPDHIFDLVDHKVLTNQKYAVDILTAVVASRPEYAHYAMRAAAFRAPATVGKTAGAAIQFAHMRSNRFAGGSTNSNPDDPAAVAAISAAAVLGVIDAKLATSLKTDAAIKAAVSGMVKAALAFQNPGLDILDPDKKAGLIGKDATFKEATGNGTGLNLDDPTAFVLRRTKGTAAVLTGAIAQLQKDDLSTAPDEVVTLHPLAKTAITAAGKAAKTHIFALAQAAGAAAAAAAVMNGKVFTDFAGIASAFLTFALPADIAKLEVAARFGATQFSNGQFGAGAAGILNYGHYSGVNAPVTSLYNF